jgi:hypothetical protein
MFIFIFMSRFGLMFLLSSPFDRSGAVRVVVGRVGAATDSRRFQELFLASAMDAFIVDELQVRIDR